MIYIVIGYVVFSVFFLGVKMDKHLFAAAYKEKA